MEERKNIGKLFDRIAWRYDGINHLLSVHIDKLWRRQAVRMMQPAQEVLDVAIGTGDMAIEIMRQGKAQHITGIDLSREMMAIGKQKTDKKNYNVDFLYASAQEMPFADNSFDAVTCTYGCRNFQDVDAGLREFHRVLKPGGQLVILEFSQPTNRIIRWLYDFYFHYIMTAIGGWIAGDKAAFNYFYRSVKGFIWGEEMVAHLQEAGFGNATYRTQTFGISTLYTARK